MKHLVTALLLTLLLGCGGGGSSTLDRAMSNRATPTPTPSPTPTATPTTSPTPTPTATPTQAPTPTPTPLPNADPQATTGVLYPAMGLGLNGIAYWGSGFPFVDLMKQATAGILESDSGNIYFDDMASQNMVDENGWPTQIPEGYIWHSIVSTDANSGNVPSQLGRYHLRYKGSGEVQVSTNGSIVSQEDGEIVFDITNENCHIVVFIRSTDPDNNGDYVRDITVVREEHLALHEAGQLFNPQWFDLVKDMRVLRFMDWQFTNGSIESQWSERNTLTTNSWGVTFELEAHRGVPLEAMVALANQAGVDPWFNFPMDATDDYIRNFAEYVAEHLDPELQAYFELSNEVWNWIFQQTQSAHNRGLETFGDQFGEFPLRPFYGYRAAQASHIVHQAFGNNASERVHFTMATQTDDNDYFLLTSIQGAEVYTNANELNISDLFDSVAVTWYFNIPDLLGDQVADWVNNYGETTASTMIFEQLLGEEDHFTVESPNDLPGIDKVLNEIRFQAALAQQYDLSVISYEGGTHLIGYGDYQDSLADFYMNVNNDPRMGDVYQAFLNAWQEIPGVTFLNHFVDVGGHSKFGSWGALRHLEDSTGRWDFIERANQPGEAPSWEQRPASTFDQGVVVHGNDQDNHFRGSEEEDFLIGYQGNDILQGGDKDDGLHGGPGNDVLHGEDGNDVLVGDDGEDELRGGAGNDRFVLVGDMNESDTIEDFSNGDILDFRHVIRNLPSNVNISEYISSENSDAGSVISLDLDGAATTLSARSVFLLEDVRDFNIETNIEAGAILIH